MAFFIVLNRGDLFDGGNGGRVCCLGLGTYVGIVNIRVSNFFSIFEKSSGHSAIIMIIQEAWMLLA
jgi:hypothetical protein